MKDSVFPKDFFWGAGSSAFQVEGDTPPTDWTEAAEEGRVPQIGKACEHYTRFREDFDLAKQLGHNAHRFSIEWARIEPKEGVFDEKEIEHYREVLRALRERGMEPFVTLYHFTLPLWFSESGGWRRRDAPEIFARYSAYTVKKLSDLCTRFATINEPYSIVINAYVRGTWPPFLAFPIVTAAINLPNGNATGQIPQRNWRGLVDFFTIANTLARAHNSAYNAIKRVVPTSDVSIVFQMHLWEANANPFWKLLARIQMWNMNYRFMNRVYKNCDSIGVNFYFYVRLGGTPERPLSDTHWPLFPDKLFSVLTNMARYQKPLYVAEVGVADEKDTHRSVYIRDAVEAALRAHRAGADVRAFLYWSLLDNYELALGYEKCFGLIAVDYKTQTRTIRPSAYVYKEIIEKNGAIISV